MSEITGRENMWQINRTFATGLSALRQMHFQKGAMFPAQFAEWMQCFHSTGALTPTRPGAAGVTDDRDCAIGQRLQANVTEWRRQCSGCICYVIRRDVGTRGSPRQSTSRHAYSGAAALTVR